MCSREQGLPAIPRFPGWSSPRCQPQKRQKCHHMYQDCHCQNGEASCLTHPCAEATHGDKSRAERQDVSLHQVVKVLPNLWETVGHLWENRHEWNRQLLDEIASDASKSAADKAAEQVRANAHKLPWALRCMHACNNG